MGKGVCDWIFIFWREGWWWEEGKRKLVSGFRALAVCHRPSPRARAPGSGAARGCGQRASSRQPQGTRTVGEGGVARLAVAGHARLSARLLKYGGSGVKTGTGSRELCDECDEWDRI